MPYPKGRPQSEESKQRRRETMLRRIAEDPEAWSEKARRAVAASHTPDGEARRNEANRRNGHPAVRAMNAAMSRPEVRARLSAERKARYANDPAWRAKMQATCLAAAHTPEVNERRRAAVIAHAATPEGRAAKQRGGEAALRSLRGASARKEWEYSGQRFRSSWEVRFARFLDGLGVSWEYEPRTFVLPDDSRYTPDFLVHVPAQPACWVEVKGVRRYGVKKFEAFRALGHRAMMLCDAEIAALA